MLSTGNEGGFMTSRKLQVATFGVGVSLLAMTLYGCDVETQADERMETEADYLRAMDELSNWGRWGADDELGAANLITSEKRLQAAALVQAGARSAPRPRHDPRHLPRLPGH